MSDPLNELDDAFREENAQSMCKAYQNEQEEAEIEQFVQETICPALKEIGKRLTSKGRRVELSQTTDGAKIVVFRAQLQEFSYEVKATPRQTPDLLQITYQQRKRQGTGPVYNNVPMNMTGTRRTLSDISRDAIHRDFTKRYMAGV